MRHSHCWFGLLLLLTACAPLPDAPVMCLFAADADSIAGAEPASVACHSATDGATRAAPALAAGEAYYIRHELPPDVEPPGKLHLRIESACGEAEELDVDHASQAEIARDLSTTTGTAGTEKRSIAFVARTAPTGAECSLVVTATIANSTLIVTTPADTDECKKVVCPSAVDTGVGGSSTSTSGGGDTGGTGGTGG